MAENKLKLLRAVLPGAKAGDYRVLVEQEITSPVKETLPPVERTFSVNRPRFTLKEEEIYGVYPPADSRAQYGETLPHLVFRSKTLPWEVACGSGETAPWVALLCLGDGEGPDLREMTLEALVRETAPGLYRPAWRLDPSTGEKGADLCRVLDLPTGLFERMMPREAELPLLCHVRVTDMGEKEDRLLEHEGYFATAVCCRFPLSDPEGRWNTAYLLSLDGYGGCLPGGPGFDRVMEKQYVRLPVLYSWRFQSSSREWPGFRRILEALDVGPLAAAEGGTAPAGEAENLLAKGYAPLAHRTRTGERTLSLYRGPLVPSPVERREGEESRTADGEIRYDPAAGVFDMSYAAAWQLGRLLCLGDRAVAAEIYRWRKSFLRRGLLRDAALLYREKTGEGEVERAFARFWEEGLAPALDQELLPMDGEGRAKG